MEKILRQDSSCNPPTGHPSIHFGVIEINKFVIPNWYLLAIAMALAGPVTMTGK